MRNRVTLPNTTEITVTPGFALPCSHVIHTTCCPWNKGSGEAVSVQLNYAVNKIRIYKSDKHETLYYAEYALLSLITCENLHQHSFFSAKLLRRIAEVPSERRRTENEVHSISRHRFSTQYSVKNYAGRSFPLLSGQWFFQLERYSICCVPTRSTVSHSL